MIQVEEFVTDEDISPFRRWFDALDDGAAALVTLAIDRLGEGNLEREAARRRRLGTEDQPRPRLSDLLRLGQQGACHSAGRRHQEAAAERYTDSVTPLA